MKRSSVTIVAFACAVAAACTDKDAAMIDIPKLSAQQAMVGGAAAPAGLQTISIGGDQLTLWPFTSPDLATGSAERDPINLIFRGQADPRSLRAALFALDGNRTAFGMPDVFPFNCTWSDANGGMQAAYAQNVGWTGSVVQLQCGAYSPLRFHLRLFPAGNWTLANAHIDLHLPGSADHQVISWELAEQLVMADFIRSGLLGAAPDVVPAFNPSPFRTIPALIYNGMPGQLKSMIGGPAGPVSGDVPIATDGNATVLTIATSVTPVAGTRSESLQFIYDTPAPRPFCSTGPTDWVYLRGPITLETTVIQAADGSYKQQMRAHGTLTVTDFNPVTGQLGASTSAQINESHEASFGDNGAHVHSTMLKKQTQADGFGASQLIRLQIGSTATYSEEDRCK